MSQRSLCLIALVAITLCTGFQGTAADVSTPITAWGAGPTFNKLVSESLSSAEFISNFVAIAMGRALKLSEAFNAALGGIGFSPDHTPDTVLLFVSQGAPSEEIIETVQRLAEGSSFTIQLPNAVDKDGRGHVFQALKPLAREARVTVLGTCAGEVLPSPATPDTLRAALEAGRPSGKTAVVVVCADSDKNAANLLADMAAVVTSFSDKHLVLHTVAEAARGSAQQRRRLFQSSSNDTSGEVCDADCQRDVKYLEGFIVFVLLGMALAVGFFCMHCIDTPTRFSGSQKHQHQE